MVNKPGNCVRNQIPIHNMVQPHRFTRDMLESMRVLQQLDEKFIVGVVSYRGEILIIPALDFQACRDVYFGERRIKCISITQLVD